MHDCKIEVFGLFSLRFLALQALVNMIVGTEWLVEATGCHIEKLRDVTTLQSVFARIITDLELKLVGEQLWHQFSAPGAGITGLAMLTESHLACHTYPEHKAATFNLYCCRTRPEWNWILNLQNLLGAKNVEVLKIERGETNRNAGILPVVVNASCVHLLPSPDPKVFSLSHEISSPRFKNVRIRGRRLQHLEREDGTYFITFRLADSLPQNLLKKIKFEREQAKKILENSSKDLSKNSEKQISLALSRDIEKSLDLGIGSCYLNNPQIAQLVADAIKFQEGKKYRLFAWCVMPNHVHVVIKPNISHDLDEILHSWKSFTANEANKILQRNGDFWQREYYDHLIRDDQEFYRIVKYVQQNPLKANLKNWSWVEVLVTNNALQADDEVTAECRHDNRQDDGGTIGGVSQ
ncbi:MAG: S-adenosylmethionine decarboxylase [Pyrinomonadaceae bacterium]